MWNLRLHMIELETIILSQLRSTGLDTGTWLNRINNWFINQLFKKMLTVRVLYFISTVAGSPVFNYQKNLLQYEKFPDNSG